MFHYKNLTLWNTFFLMLVTCQLFKNCLLNFYELYTLYGSGVFHLFLYSKTACRPRQINSLVSRTLSLQYLWQGIQDSLPQILLSPFLNSIHTFSHLFVNSLIILKYLYLFIHFYLLSLRTPTLLIVKPIRRLCR